MGKLSGAVGTFGHLKPEHEASICARLGLRADPIATQVIQRDRHAAYIATLAVLASTLDKIATEIRHLQRTEVREAEEFFSEKQKGSSSMPHKRNPITSEQISGLARVIRANTQAALENVPLWHERDISHSSVERIIFPDSTILTDYLLAKTTSLIENLLVYPQRMLKNLESTGGLIFSGQLLLDLAEAGMSREEAYRLVQAHAMRAWKEDLVFRDLVEQDPAISTRLPQLERTFQFERQLENVDAIFERVSGVNLTVAMTGASGSIFGQRMLRALERDQRVSHINFIASENSLRVMAEELQLSGRSELAAKLLGKPSSKVQQLAESDIGAGPASGSYPSAGMIILPCSMGTLAGIANGLASNLIERAADVSLKERRPLILCIRETPFNKIHLRNMSLAADAGAVIFPVIPAFYNRPMDAAEMAEQFVCRVLAHIGLPQAGRLCVERPRSLTELTDRGGWDLTDHGHPGRLGIEKSHHARAHLAGTLPRRKMPAVGIHIQLRLQYLVMELIGDRQRNQAILVAPADEHRHRQAAELAIHQVVPGHHRLHTATNDPAHVVASAEQRQSQKARQRPWMRHQQLFEDRHIAGEAGWKIEGG